MAARKPLVIISGSQQEIPSGDAVPPTSGGTGLTALGSALQQLRVNAAGNALEYASPTAAPSAGASLAAYQTCT